MMTTQGQVSPVKEDVGHEVADETHNDIPHVASTNPMRQKSQSDTSNVPVIDESKGDVQKDGAEDTHYEVIIGTLDGAPSDELHVPNKSPMYGSSHTSCKDEIKPPKARLNVSEMRKGKFSLSRLSRWKDIRNIYDDAIDAGEWASFEDPPGVYHAENAFVEEMHTLVVVFLTSLLWAFMYFVYFAIPGSTWVETNSLGRAVHLLLTAFGGGGYGLALMPMGLDVRTWWKEKKFMLYWSLKYTFAFSVICFTMMEVTGAKKQLHMTYIMAMMALTIILLPLYEGVRFLAGDKHYMNPCYKPSFAILEGFFYHLLAACAALTPQIYFILDNCYLSFGNVPWDETLKSDFIVYARPFLWMCVKRFTVTVMFLYVNSVRIPCGVLYGHLIAYAGLAFVTGTGAASCTSWFFCAQYVFCDWLTFTCRIWCFSGWGQRYKLGAMARKFLIWGKTEPIHGMNRKQLRGLDILSEDNANTTAFLAIVMLYGFCSIPMQGVDTLKVFVFPSGLQSFQYVLVMGLSEVLQDQGGKIYISWLLRKLCLPCSYSKIWGKCWSPNVWRTQATLLLVSSFNITIMAWVIPAFKSHSVGVFGQHE